MTDKTARELLEEAHTMIVTPLAKVGDTMVTGWRKNDEYVATYEYHPKGVIEIIEPDYARPAGTDQDTVSIYRRGVCAIGAVALASLTNDGFAYKPNTYSSWRLQVNNPQVALATVALAKAIIESGYKYPEPFESLWQFDFIDGVGDRDYTADDLRKLWDRPSFSDLVKKAQEEPSQIKVLAMVVVRIVTYFNDTRDSWMEVSAAFEQAIKLLISAEEVID